jgi:hypothetical protein
MMPEKKSTSAMSSLAARVLKGKFVTQDVSADEFNALLGNAKALAGSVLSQDETKGQE